MTNKSMFVQYSVFSSTNVRVKSCLQFTLDYWRQYRDKNTKGDSRAVPDSSLVADSLLLLRSFHTVHTCRYLRDRRQQVERDISTSVNIEVESAWVETTWRPRGDQLTYR